MGSWELWTSEQPANRWLACSGRCAGGEELPASCLPPPVLCSVPPPTRPHLDGPTARCRIAAWAASGPVTYPPTGADRPWRLAAAGSRSPSCRLRPALRFTAAAARVWSSGGVVGQSAAPHGDTGSAIQTTVRSCAWTLDCWARLGDSRILVQLGFFALALPWKKKQNHKSYFWKQIPFWVLKVYFLSLISQTPKLKCTSLKLWRWDNFSPWFQNNKNKRWSWLYMYF